MIHLLDKLYLNYDFSGPRFKNNCVYINELGTMTFDGESAPIEAYSSIEAVYKEYGDLTTFLEYLLSFQKEIHILTDAETLEQIHSAHLYSLFPAISAEMVQHLIRLHRIYAKYGLANYTQRTTKEREEYRNLKVPLREEAEAIRGQTSSQRPYSIGMKKAVGIEFLVAHALIVDFDDDDPFVNELADRVDDAMWDLFTRDFINLRRRVLFGLYRGRELFNIEIDLEADDIDKEFERHQDELLFNNLDNYLSRDYVKKHSKQMRTLLRQVQYAGEWPDDLATLIYDMLQTDRRITVDELRFLVHRDRDTGNSAVFDRASFLNRVNGLLINYFFQAPVEEFRCLKLTNE